MEKFESKVKVKDFDFQLEVKVQSDQVMVKDLSDQKLKEIRIPLPRVVGYGVKQLISDAVAGKKPATKAEIWSLFEKRALKRKQEKIDLAGLREFARQGDLEAIKRLLGIE